MADILEKSVDFLFKYKWLILIILLATVLRFFVAGNLAPLGDEMVHGPHAINIIESGQTNSQNQSILWFYLSDIALKIFGVTALSSRFLSFFFGILTIPLLFIIVKRNFNKKIALISSFLLAISAFHIRYTLIEMDITMMFFVLLSFYLFTKCLEEKEKISLLAVVAISLAVLAKPIAMWFGFSFIFLFLIFLYHKSIEKRKEIIFNNKWNILLSVIIVFLFMAPVFVFNYLLYKEKGITDVIFARFLGISRDIYSSLQGYDAVFSLTAIPRGILWFIKDTMFTYDPLLLFFSLIGLPFAIKNFKKGTRDILVLATIPFFFLIGTSLLQTHYTSFLPLMAPFAAVFILKVKEKVNFKYLLTAIIILILVVNLFYLMPHLSSKSAISKGRNLAISEFEENSLVIVDARIYRGRIAWMFNDKHYIESTNIQTLFDVMNEIPGNSYSVKTYYIECVPDDCGWGTITEGPLNSSSEQTLSFFKNISISEKTIYGGGGYDEVKGEPYFKIYETQLNVKPQVFDLVDSTHMWFYYPVRYQMLDKLYDSYTPKGIVDKSLDVLGHYMLWLAVFLAIISPLYLAYLFREEEKH